MISIDIDTGGTFTDAFVVRDGEPHAVKVLTTPHDLAVCFREVIAKAAEELGFEVSDLLREAETVRYATTVGTNAIIQRTGPRLGLLGGPPDEGVYGLFVDRDMVAGADGMQDLLNASARGLVCALPEAQAERDVRAVFEESYPKHCLDAVPLLLSHEIAPDPDDARRAATALFNAYVHPDVAGYLYRAEDHLRDHGYRRPLLVVHNDGGCARVAKTVAARTYNSGPAAGLLGAHEIAELYGIDELVTFDMGGTSLDVAFVSRGQLPLCEHGRVEGVEISFPLPDLLALGAGGGSIASRDADGRLRVGPRSAGAKPGPACFGFGGTEATVTDADVALGILDPERFLGGQMRLEPERALKALGELGGDPVALAAEVRATVDAEMGERIGAELRERGFDGAAMLAYGGAGPMHACAMAERAGISRVLTVPFASVFSAFGASSADVIHSYEAPPGEEDALRERALRDMRGEGFGPDRVELEASNGDRARLRARAELAHFAFAPRASNGAGPVQPRTTRTVQGAETPIYEATALAVGQRVEGPAVLEAPDTTIVVPSGWTYRTDEYGNGELTR